MMYKAKEQFKVQTFVCLSLDVVASSTIRGKNGSERIMITCLKYLITFPTAIKHRSIDI